MAQHRCSLGGIVLAALLFASGVLAAPIGGTHDAPTPRPGHPLDEADLSAWLDGRLPYALKAGDIAGVVVVVVKDGKVLLQKGYGLADVQAKRGMDPELTMVRPGSTSKLFTWTAVMQQVEQGRIDLDRNVNDYLDFKVPEPFGKPVTMRDLMNHRGGFEEGLKDILVYDTAHAVSNAHYLKDHPRTMLFAPGSVPAYSNYGVALAGYIVERVSGEPFDAYVTHHIFEPLGMSHSTTAQPLPPPFLPLAAKGYRTASDPAASPFEILATAPAGSASVTAADMARFMLAHLQQGQVDGHAILRPGTTALMHLPTSPALPGFTTMAHGFFRSQQNGRTILGHGGDTIVFHSELDLLPDENVGIFFSFNSRGKDDSAYGARRELFDGFMDRYFPATPAAEPVSLPSASVDAPRIAGRYQGSRRVETSFFSALYLLHQTVITANADGTIGVPDSTGQRLDVFRETAPGLWRKVGGVRQLKLAEVDGVKTVIDSDDASGVLQASTVAKSAPVTLGVLSFSLAVFVLALVYWVVEFLVLRSGGIVRTSDVAVVRLRRLQRAAVLCDVLYLSAWVVFIKPLLSTDIGGYNSGNDAWVRLLQAGGLVAIAALLLGAWTTWRLLRTGATRLTKTWAVLVTLALVGVVWIAMEGGLLSWNLNY